MAVGGKMDEILEILVQSGKHGTGTSSLKLWNMNAWFKRKKEKQYVYVFSLCSVHWFMVFF